ncbi:MAG: NUDIX domain-containing protein [Planctomycetes bacterium]|nr:NUDIX domain-containing protein [Planctomycetota bacterium]
MEFVFVVPRPALFPDFYPHGLIRFQDAPAQENTCVSRTAFEAAIAREGFFVERPMAERTPAWKQIIPYTLVQCGERILLTRRTKSGGEARLHDKHSIGIGGHINPIDLDEAPLADGARNPLPAGARREIGEELDVRGAYELRPLGILNDDSNSVGAVHVGVVHVMRVEGSVEVREKEQLEGRLVTITELRELAERGANLETWTKLLLPHLEELLFTPTAAAT